MSNLLKDASILLTPTAYENGRMNAIKPSKDLYGPELVTNGDFATDSNWTKGTGWSISNGKASCDGVSFGNYLSQTSASTLILGKTYKVSFDLEYTSGTLFCLIGSSNPSTNTSGNITTGGSKEFYITISTLSDQLIYFRSNYFVGSIDNVSVVEDLSGDFNFERNSAATRVNAQGLVENVQIISPELVSNGNFSQIGTEKVLNGDFSEIGTEEVLNGNFSQEGSELVTNGDFATDSDWNKGTGWSINGGKADSDGSGNYQSISQSSLVSPVGKTYKVTYEVSDYVSGEVRCILGGFTLGQITSSNGVVTEYLTASNASSNTFVYIETRGSGFIGSIDNVSVKEVGQNWTLGTGWSIGDGVANYNNNANNQIAQNVNLNAGIYKLKFSISNTTGNGGRIWIGNFGGSVSYTDNTYQYYTNGDYTLNINVPSNQTTFAFYGNTSGNSFSISNISIKEVGQNWTLGTSWSIGDDKAISDGTSGNLSQVGTVTPNKQYKIQATISDYVSGNAEVSAGAVPRGQMSANGTYTFYQTASTTSNFFVISNSFNGSISNISVKEVGQDWTVTDSDANNYVEFNQEQGTARLKFLNTSPITNLRATAQYVGGKKYKLIVDVAEVVSGGIKIDAGGVSQTYNSVGIQEAIIEPTGTSVIYFYRATSNVDITLNSVSLKEITDDTNIPRINYEGFSYQDVLGSELVLNSNFNDNSWWGLDANWSILNGAANSNGTGTMYKGGVLTVGKNYKVVVSVSSYTSGTLNYPNASKFLPSESGVYTFYYTANSQTVSFTGNSFIGSIDNVSVKEYLGQEVVPDSGCGSWLLEPQSTNLLEQSELFSDSYWSKSGASVVDGFISPEGLSNAYKLVENTATTTHQIQRSFSFLNQKYSLSAFLKADERNWIKVNLYDGSSSVYAYFDLTNGVVGQELGATGKIENYGNGWYRCSIATTLSVSAGTGNISLRLAENNGGTGYLGDGTSGAYIYGAMLEQQSHPTSYIPTSGASATRLQDIANNSGNSSLINSTEGVLYAEIAALSDDETYRTISMSDGTNNNTIRIEYEGSVTNRFRAVYAKDGDYSGGITHTFDITQNIKIAYKYAENNLALWINGIEVGTYTGTKAMMPSNTVNTLDFTRADGANNFFGKTKCVAVYKEALTDANLRCLTYPNPVATTFDLDFDTIAEQFTFTRGSEATFVNEQGLIESTNQIGPELVTNGDFATDSDWSKGTGWSISDGVATYDGTGGTQSLVQGNIQNIELGKLCKVTIDVLSNEGNGANTIFLGGTVLNGNHLNVGSHTFFGSFTSNTNFYVYGRSGEVFKIDNVSVKEVTTATNTPRIDYSTGAKAFLLEPQSTNLITYSEDFSNAVWSKNDVTATSGFLAPDGTANAFKVEKTGSNAHLVGFSGQNTNKRKSIYARTVSGIGKVSLLNVQSDTNALFDLTEQWQRFDITNSGADFFYAVDFRNTGATLSEVLIWGAQLEQQSFATSYIPTSGASATRNQELCNNATPVINSEEGTLYAEISALGLESSSSLGVSDGSGSNRVLILLQSNGDIRGFIASNGVIVFDEIYSGISALNNNKIAISYKLNNFTLWINGVKRFTDTSGNTPIGLSELSFDNGSGASNFFGNTKDLKYYPKALADVQLEDLTTI